MSPPPTVTLTGEPPLSTNINARSNKPRSHHSSGTVSFSLPPIQPAAVSSEPPGGPPQDSLVVRRDGFEPGTALSSGGAGTMTSAIYRSVPPRPLSYTFSDVLQASLDPRATGGRKTKSRSKTAPVSTNAPEEYAERFKARPTTRPAVIDFNGTTVKLHTTRAVRRSYPGFPPVKTMHVQSKQAQPKTPANEVGICR
ncbi:hypothetical protein BaRGS_00007834 [Batillaria attramentaria]|uniref:Uncharacterized protein n=1 Tax=Batillaria attramentaria TaxID=370345 RepID=A0ABD0LND0_9CAEN